MRPEIQEIIDRKNNEFEMYEQYKQVKENEKQQREKTALLDRMGAYSIVYYDASAQEPQNYAQLTEEYPEVEISSDGTQKRYKKVYYDVTDEEYEALKNAAELIPEEKSSRHGKTGLFSSDADLDAFTYEEQSSCTMAKVLTGIAVATYLAFFVIGFIMGGNTIANYLSSRSEFSFGTALVYWIAGFISGSMLLGFAHIVDNLYKQTILLTKLLKK